MRRTVVSANQWAALRETAAAGAARHHAEAERFERAGDRFEAAAQVLAVTGLSAFSLCAFDLAPMWAAKPALIASVTSVVGCAGSAMCARSSLGWIASSNYRRIAGRFEHAVGVIERAEDMARRMGDDEVRFDAAKRRLDALVDGALRTDRT
jgi:hypothetical protein